MKLYYKHETYVGNCEQPSLTLEYPKTVIKFFLLERSDQEFIHLVKKDDPHFCTLLDIINVFCFGCI